MNSIKSTIHSHWQLIAICLVYFTSGLLVELFTSPQAMRDPSFYYFFLNKFLFSFLVLFFSLKFLQHLIVNFRSGIACLLPLYRGLRQDYLSMNGLLRFSIVYLLIPPFMFSYSTFKQSIPLFNGFSCDPWLSRLDHIVHFNHDPWELLQPWLGHPSLTRFFDFGYTIWGLLFLYTMLWLAYSRRETLRLHFFLSLALCWILIGNLTATLLASAGPCYYAHVVPDSAGNYQSMLSYLRSIPDLQATRFQDALWQAYSGGEFIPYGGISAMPSMHVSVAVLLALVYTRYNKWLGLPFILFAILIQIGSVHLGWHYAIDGYVSIILTILIWYLVSRYLRFLNNSKCPGDNPA